MEEGGDEGGGGGGGEGGGTGYRHEFSRSQEESARVRGCAAVITQSCTAQMGTYTFRVVTDGAREIPSRTTGRSRISECVLNVTLAVEFESIRKIREPFLKTSYARRLRSSIEIYKRLQDCSN
ncbi:hypothetical protein V1477_001196 [Vespula maculifrons]|uniref:Uncharacterized protein n=1 Tax=Vespula maculifrons TaxID=7453 RepID=A0ABD2CZR1_VESMC